jgi:hypothetical protein
MHQIGFGTNPSFEVSLQEMVLAAGVHGQRPQQMARPTLVILQSNPNAAEIVVRLQSAFSKEAAVSPLSARLE